MGHCLAQFELPGGDGPETFLAGGIPNLQLDGLAVQLNGADFEVHADGGNIRLGVRVIRKSEQQARFAHARIANQEQLEQVITET